MSRIKKHLQDNKKFYIGVGAGAAIVLVATKIGSTNVTVSGTGNQVVGRAKEVNQVMISMIERSTASKPVHLVGTNLYFNSLSEAARETGHSLSKISRNINGHIPDIDGQVFELLELAA